MDLLKSLYIWAIEKKPKNKKARSRESSTIQRRLERASKSLAQRAYVRTKKDQRDWNLIFTCFSSCTSDLHFFGRLMALTLWILWQLYFHSPETVEERICICFNFNVLQVRIWFPFANFMTFDPYPVTAYRDPRILIRISLLMVLGFNWDYFNFVLCWNFWNTMMGSRILIKGWHFFSFVFCFARFWNGRWELKIHGGWSSCGDGIWQVPNLRPCLRWNGLGCRGHGDDASLFRRTCCSIALESLCARGKLNYQCRFCWYAHWSLLLGHCFWQTWPQVT